ncbi:ROK family protein [Leifsonia sp. 21MFCrub1.1]|uniref:ROK family protein n=1 Tax=Leifsonia sp. 21MFCrub1.1 TaxID=1798223 RepID=UPI0008928DE4|nr:ROK family protein [Leifsonia sp. 21MFCrub1.1]SEA58913.1 glucokinase [Leifsonia sp. 21MFCrub1.1]
MTAEPLTPLPAAAPLGDGAPVLAFDVGGTDTKAALVDAAGRLVQVVRIPTPHAGDATGDAVVAAIAAVAERFRAEHPGVVPQAAGLLVPGHVDDDAGVGIFAENLGWRDFPFRDRAEAALGVPVAFSHDVRGAGEAEHRLGAAAPYRDVVVMAIGTGIAGAIFLDGRLHTGGGLAGEMGHSRVADGPLCACGGIGCLEAVASAAAIARRYNALTGSDVPGAREVLALAQSGDEAARAVWDSAVDALALDLSHTVALLAPEAVVIGGGLAQAGPALFEPLAEKLDAILTFHRRPVLLPASIGENAGLIGAALRARDRSAGSAARSVEPSAEVAS